MGSRCSRHTGLINRFAWILLKNWINQSERLTGKMGEKYVRRVYREEYCLLRRYDDHVAQREVSSSPADYIADVIPVQLCDE